MYPCVRCDRLFGSVKALEQHQQDSPVHIKIFQCDRASGSEQALDQHQRDAPGHAGTFDCKTCNRSFGSVSALKQHQRDSRIHRHPLQASIAVNLIHPPSQASELPDAKIKHHPRDVHTSKGDPGISSNIPIRKKTSTLKEEKRVFFTFPELHQSIAEAIAQQTTSLWFYENNHDDKYKREHSTKVMGRFECKNKTCKKQSWGSKIVAVWIREHARNGYSALVYNQRCKSCNHLGDLTVDKECYIDRIAYRLKKWAGVMMQQPPFELKTGPPHEAEYCEGCKRGVCPQTKNATLY